MLPQPADRAEHRDGAASAGRRFASARAAARGSASRRASISGRPCSVRSRSCSYASPSRTISCSRSSSSHERGTELRYGDTDRLAVHRLELRDHRLPAIPDPALRVATEVAGSRLARAQQRQPSSALAATSQGTASRPGSRHLPERRHRRVQGWGAGGGGLERGQPEALVGAWAHDRGGFASSHRFSGSDTGPMSTRRRRAPGAGRRAWPRPLPSCHEPRERPRARACRPSPGGGAHPSARPRTGGSCARSRRRIITSSARSSGTRCGTMRRPARIGIDSDSGHARVLRLDQVLADRVTPRVVGQEHHSVAGRRAPRA